MEINYYMKAYRRGMKLNKGITSVALLIILQIFSCGRRQPDGTQQEALEQEAIPVETMAVAVQEFPQIIQYSGNIEPWETALISGQSGMRINRILFDEGDRVRSGQLLAEMSSAQLEQARSQLELARREVERLDTLYRIGSVSGQRLDQAQTELRTAQSNFENLAENTRLTAPFSGIITNRFFSPGEVFVPGANTPAILTLMQISPARVIVNISERFFSQVNEGMEAIIRSDVYPDREFTGRVYRKSPVLDRESRNFQTEIRVENNDMVLRPGMFARVSINLGNLEGIYIPSTAVVRQQGTTNHFVFVRDGDRVERVAVQTGVRFQELIKIESGLQEGQEIVTEGMGRLNDGTPIRVINQTATL